MPDNIQDPAVNPPPQAQPANASGVSTFPNTSGTDSSTPAAASVTGTPAAPVANQPTAAAKKIRPNALSKYASVNYIIELMTTDKTGLDAWQNGGKFLEKNWVTIISSLSGLGGATAPGGTAESERWFTREYYLDNLEIESIVGTNNNARATADISVTFTVTEPYGINLIQELWSYSTEALKQEIWNETPYLLRITWKGYDDQGKLTSLENFVKYIPVKIVNIECKLTNNGAVYTVTAIPWTMVALDQKYGYVKNSIHCEGKTIKDILLGDKENTLTLQNALNLEANQEAIKNTPEGYKILPPTYDFVPLGTLGNEIFNAALSDAKNIDPQNTPVQQPLEGTPQKRIWENLRDYQLLARSNSNRISLDMEKQKVEFKAGSIVEILGQLIINSKYITEQIREYREDYIINNGNPSPKPFKWFRIIPKTVIDLSQLDPSTNLYKKIITYYIVGYEIASPRVVGNSLVPSVTADTLGKEVVKEYNYFFTGNNTEIINLDLSFNTQYFTYRPRNPRVMPQAQGQKPLLDTDSDEKKSNLPPEKNKSDLSFLAGSAAVGAAQTEHNSLGMGTTTLDRSVAGQVASALYSNVDQLEVELEIMGDPDLIKQDGIFYIDKIEDDSDVPIVFNAKERYVSLTFKSPRDINDETGIIQENQDVIFNGYYTLISINSHFKEGKFTQNLKMIKAGYDYLDKTADQKYKRDRPLTPYVTSRIVEESSE